MYVYKYSVHVHVYLLCMIKVRVRWCTCSLWRITLSKLVGLLFLFCPPSSLFKIQGMCSLDLNGNHFSILLLLVKGHHQVHGAQLLVCNNRDYKCLIYPELYIKMFVLKIIVVIVLAILRK